MPVLATDDFNRADSVDLGATWDSNATEAHDLNINSNHATTTGASDGSETYNAVTWPNNQYSSTTVTVSVNTLGAGLGPIVRSSATAQTYYRAIMSNTASGDNIKITKYVAGTFTSLATKFATYVADAPLYMEITDATIRIKYNGTAVAGAIVDSTIGSGKAGIAYSSTTPGVSTDFINSWEGGSTEPAIGFIVNNLPPRIFAPRIAR